MAASYLLQFYAFLQRKPLAKNRVNSGSTQNTYSDLSPDIDRTQISNETFRIQLETRPSRSMQVISSELKELNHLMHACIAALDISL